jgi:cyclopropane fatty-acyl-phospholipid synthase-like methyltransferase
MSRAYVHGYDQRESVRLQDQASSVLDLLHSDTRYPPGSSVLEAGCGTGAQTVTLARNNPDTRFTSVDLSKVSLEEAKQRVAAAGLEQRAVPAGRTSSPCPSRRRASTTCSCASCSSTWRARSRRCAR